MPSLDKYEPDHVQESAYRRGYTHGVEAALMLIEGKLSMSDRGKIGKWRNQLMEWRGPLGMHNFEENFKAPNPPTLDSL